MKQNQKLSVLFGIFTVILLCAMCAAVAFSYARMICYMEHCGASAPPSVAFFLAIPFGIGILINAGLCWFFYRKQKNSK